MSYKKPDAIKRLEKQIEELETEKEEAIKGEAYEKAGEIKRRQAEKKEKPERALPFCFHIYLSIPAQVAS